MEEIRRKKRKKTMIRGDRGFIKSKTGEQRLNLQSHTVFPLLLAALLTESRGNKALVKKCLDNIFLSLPRFLSTPVLSLLPALLKSDCAEIACKSADIAGAACLLSFEMNEKIASEDEIIKSLILMLGSFTSKIPMAACNAMLDLSTASVGRLRLLEFSAIEKIFRCSIQAYKSSGVVVSISSDEILYKDDEYPSSLLHIATTLTNSSTIQRLKRVPPELSESFRIFLKREWSTLNMHRFRNTFLNGDLGRGLCRSNVKINDLAESIFRLSIASGVHLPLVAVDLIKKRIFGSGENALELFLLNSWEISPLLIRDSSQASSIRDDIFNPFIQLLGPKDEIPNVIPSILKYCTSCPSLESDELDILKVIEGLRSLLGCPLIYNQDIRVVKTLCRKRELHYFKEPLDSNRSMGRYILHWDEISKFEEAFGKGYSIALRGMEFRFQIISAIADELASLFGQPSVGVNMYLTPSNSQGLVRHIDDHCVFVCQLIGMKRWTIFSQAQLQLPRLYESLHTLHDVEDETQSAGQQYVLKEGDILYIPRGFPHEAHTLPDDDEECNKSTGFSLHLTLAIEIEPPFEWEGFMHIALHSWGKNSKTLPMTSLDSVPENLYFTSLILLHVAITLIGNIVPTFRKACLVGSTSFASVSKDFFNNNQKIVFGFLVDRIASDSIFSDVLKHIEAALEKTEDPLENVRWMKDLAVDNETEDGSGFDTLFADSRSQCEFSIKHKDIAEDAFLQGRLKFCEEVEFHIVEVDYVKLLEKYRKVRKQYSNGMLSLHCNIGQ